MFALLECPAYNQEHPDVDHCHDCKKGRAQHEGPCNWFFPAFQTLDTCAMCGDTSANHFFCSQFGRIGGLDMFVYCGQSAASHTVPHIPVLSFGLDLNDPVLCAQRARSGQKLVVSHNPLENIVDPTLTTGGAPVVSCGQGHRSRGCGSRGHGGRAGQARGAGQGTASAGPVSGPSQVAAHSAKMHEDLPPSKGEPELKICCC